MDLDLVVFSVFIILFHLISFTHYVSIDQSELMFTIVTIFKFLNEING